ncbi:hypothetical protein B0H11DRAFT_2269071 [Mycena galericulata]|nr:hypothetical protein B0H11DRAFT_2269071 [Mycena galericulata]
MPENDPSLFHSLWRLSALEQNSGVLHLLEAIQQHAGVIPAAEQWVMEESIGCMLDVLATATVQSEDIVPSGPGISVSQLFVMRGLQARRLIQSLAFCVGALSSAVIRSSLVWNSWTSSRFDVNGRPLFDRKLFHGSLFPGCIFISRWFSLYGACPRLWKSLWFSYI